MRISGRLLVLLWVVGATGFALQMYGTMRRARAELPKARAYIRAAREREAQRRLDSAIAFARAPRTVTPAGDTVRAIAYTGVGLVIAGKEPPNALLILALVWVFKIPFALLVLTGAYLIDRGRRGGPTITPAG
jgi:hypothetical protein